MKWPKAFVEIAELAFVAFLILLCTGVIHR